MGASDQTAAATNGDVVGAASLHDPVEIEPSAGDTRVNSWKTVRKWGGGRLAIGSICPRCVSWALDSV